MRISLRISGKKPTVVSENPVSLGKLGYNWGIPIFRHTQMILLMDMATGIYAGRTRAAELCLFWWFCKPPNRYKQFNLPLFE
jgi:hypothetical protein